MRCLPQKQQTIACYAKRKEKKEKQNGHPQTQKAFEKEQT
jgi:hypothetical protein